MRKTEKEYNNNSIFNKQILYQIDKVQRKITVTIYA